MMQLTPDDLIELEAMVDDLHALGPIQLGDGKRILTRNCDKLRAWIAAAKAPPEPAPAPASKKGKPPPAEATDPEKLSHG